MISLCTCEGKRNGHGVLCQFWLTFVRTSKILLHLGNYSLYICFTSSVHWFDISSVILMQSFISFSYICKYSSPFFIFCLSICLFFRLIFEPITLQWTLIRQASLLWGCLFCYIFLSLLSLVVPTLRVRERTASYRLMKVYFLWIVITINITFIHLSASWQMKANTLLACAVSQL